MVHSRVKQRNSAPAIHETRFKFYLLCFSGIPKRILTIATRPKPNSASLPRPMKFYLTVRLPTRRVIMINTDIITDSIPASLLINFRSLIAAHKRAIFDQFGENGLKQGVPDGKGGVFCLLQFYFCNSSLNFHVYTQASLARGSLVAMRRQCIKSFLAQTTRAFQLFFFLLFSSSSFSHHHRHSQLWIFNATYLPLASSRLGSAQI